MCMRTCPPGLLLVGIKICRRQKGIADMLFNSYYFIFLFLPIALAGYYFFNYVNQNRLANIFLIGMSLWFYGYFNISYLTIICCSIIANFLIAKIMEYFSESQRVKKSVLFLGICANIAVIFYFKYYDFFLENMNALFHQSFELKNILLPLGISFFTFQQLSYLVDSSRGETKGYSFDEYALFVSFFPQLIAGPIVLHSETIPQFRKPENRRINYRNFSKGIYIFALGLFKKVIIADTFGKSVDYGFLIVPSLNTLETFLISFCYMFQLYFDFSGYCDMAIGISAMFNIELPQNFNSPYQADSITDFWDRWHMSLTRFLKTYIYFPLGGNRRGQIRTYVNIMIVFLISGIWHGANWTFVLWGALHGILNCLNRIFRGQWSKLCKPIRWGTTFLAVDFLWIIFRADNIGTAKTYFKQLFAFTGFQIREELLTGFCLTEFAFLEERIPVLQYLAAHITGFYLWFFLLAAFITVLFLKNSRELVFKPTIGKSVITVICMLWSVLSLAGISAFLYFNF